jgi:tryptophan synthase beta chain
LQDEYGQVTEAHSISAGLDYPGVGPEHAYLSSIGRATYVPVNDDEVLDALQLLARTEGIIPALESAHAVAYVVRAARTGEIEAGASVMITLSGRGDKDAEQIMNVLRPKAAE